MFLFHCFLRVSLFLLLALAGISSVPIFLYGAGVVTHPFSEENVYPPNNNTYQADPSAMWLALNAIGIACHNKNLRFTKPRSIYIYGRSKNIGFTAFSKYPKLDEKRLFLNACLPGGSMHNRVLMAILPLRTQDVARDYNVFPGLHEQNQQLNRTALKLTSANRATRANKNRRQSFFVRIIFSKDMLFFYLFFCVELKSNFFNLYIYIFFFCPFVS